MNFIEAIIDTLSTEFNVNNDRVYACGYSEGGIFSYELGCRLNNRIAAFGSVSGSMLTDHTDYLIILALVLQLIQLPYY